MHQWSSSVFVAVLPLLLVIFSLQVILSGATVTVGTSSQWADEGSDNSVTCTPSEAVLYLRWYKSSTLEEFTNAQQILQLYVPTGFVTFDSSVNQSHYSFDKSASDYPLTVQGVGLDDEVRYWCEVEPSNGDPNKKDKTTFQVRRIPASIVVEHAGIQYTDGEKADVIEGENQFKCSVLNIKPAAKFTWRLGSKDLVSFTMWNETSENPRLVNSYSTLTATVNKSLELTCMAQNKQDGTTTPDQAISIMLKKITDSCKGGPCLNGGTCSPTADGFQCACVDGFKGDNCTKVTPTSGPTPTTLQEWVIILIIVIVVVIIGGCIIIVVCYCYCKKRKSEREQGDRESNTPMECHEPRVT